MSRYLEVKATNRYIRYAHGQMYRDSIGRLFCVQPDEWNKPCWYSCSKDGEPQWKVSNIKIIEG